MSFKMGDKAVVIICDRTCEEYRGKIGTIIDIDRIKKGLSGYWDYEVKFSDGFCYVFTPIEIRKAPTKNQQLLFDFMSKEK